MFTNMADVTMLVQFSLPVGGTAGNPIASALPYDYSGKVDGTWCYLPLKDRFEFVPHIDSKNKVSFAQSIFTTVNN